MLLSTTARVNVLNNISGKSGSFTIGSNGNCWLGLSTADPGNTGSSFTEPATASNYARVNIYSLMGTPTTSGAVTSIANDSDINFNMAVKQSDPSAATGADWGTIVAVGLFTASTGGSPYAWGLLDTSVSVPTQSSLHFYQGKFKISIQEAT